MDRCRSYRRLIMLYLYACSACILPAMHALLHLLQICQDGSMPSCSSLCSRLPPLYAHTALHQCSLRQLMLQFLRLYQDRAQSLMF